jgi:dTDP-4-amino-4,6-dideoxygalactose transaminase
LFDLVLTIDLAAGFHELEAEIGEAVSRVFATGWYVLGQEVEAFEREFASYCGVSHCIGVGNGTDALALILRACGVRSGDEVIVPAYTAVATWMAVSMLGATPVGVDVSPATYNLEPAAVEAAISPRTQAIVAVHLFGQPADMDALESIADARELVLIEDAAQAHGARHRGKVVGGLGRAASFSFYPTKNLGAMGDGGAVVTNDEELAYRVRMLRSYGWRSRSVSEVLGVNTRLDEVQAALLRVKLGRLDDWNDRRRDLAAGYLDGLAGVAGIQLPAVPDWTDPVWHQFVVGVEDRAGVQRSVADAEIQTLVHYDPLPHLTPAYRDLGWAAGVLPIAERLASRAISLPMYPQLSSNESDRVVEALRMAVD